MLGGEERGSVCFRSEENVEYTRKHFTFKGEERLNFFNVCNYLNCGYGIYTVNMSI
jgi:hypothetical protein